MSGNNVYIYLYIYIYISKKEACSPTMSLESTLTLIIITAHEKRNVTTADIAGAYVNADMDEDVYVKFTGSMMEILCELIPQYKQVLVMEKGKSVLNA